MSAFSMPSRITLPLPVRSLSPRICKYFQQRSYPIKLIFDTLSVLLDTGKESPKTCSRASAKRWCRTCLEVCLLFAPFKSVSQTAKRWPSTSLSHSPCFPTMLNCRTTCMTTTSFGASSTLLRQVETAVSLISLATHCTVTETPASNCQILAQFKSKTKHKLDSNESYC